MGQVVKTAVSIPQDKYRKAELLRKKTGDSRSALYSKALDSLFSSMRVRELEERYEAGYRAHPENTLEMRAILKASAPVIGKEKWRVGRREVILLPPWGI